MSSYRRLLLVMGCAPVAACASYRPAQVANPPEITLTEALTDVVDALNAARARSEQHNERIGLNPCTVTAVFNVAAKATEGGKLVLGVTAGPPAIPAGLSTSGEISRTAEGSRGNQVTVLLTSPACLPEGSLGATHPEKIVQAQDQISRARGGGPNPWLNLRRAPPPGLRDSAPLQPGLRR